MSVLSGVSLLAFVAILLIIFGSIGALMRFLRKVDQGKALIRVSMGKNEATVSFTSIFVVPILHKVEVMDISLKTIEIERRGREGLICRDNIRADIRVTFFVRVNPTTEDVRKVAQSIGCDRASDRETLEELFIAKFSEALKTVGKQLDFEDLYRERDSFRDKIKELIGDPSDLGGYVLQDAAIDYLEQTPLSSLDPENILDAQGIRKITELTALQNVQTNQFKNQEQMTMTQQNVKARETILELERQQAEVVAKQGREVKNAQAHEQAEIDSVASKERLRSETARIQTEEQVAIQEENKRREVEVAQQNRSRVVGIEEERVKLAREQEVIAREREIELQRIAKEKALEEQRRDIAQVIRERVAVEKTVAEEEERIKEVRALAEASRQKQVKIMNAEAQAQETLVIDIKAAEASNEASKFRIQEKLALADAEREVADKSAAAKIRLAEGIQAEQAAVGLAQVTVREATALITEKEGAAEAKATLEKMRAQAAGEEQQGLAEVRVKEANALAIEKQGVAEARALLEKLQAEATGIEQKGLAQAHIQEAEVKVREMEAQAIEKQGLAQAIALKERLLAEAVGLAEKFKSLDALSEGGRDHEEFRLQLEQQLQVQRLTVEMQKTVAESQVQILAEALKHAHIDIVGGDNMFFDRMVNAISLAKSTDSFVEKSATTQTLLKDYLEGNASLTQDIKEVLSNPSITSSDLKNLTLSAFLSKLLATSSPEQKVKLAQLHKVIKRLELGDVKLEALPKSGEETSSQS